MSGEAMDGLRWFRRRVIGGALLGVGAGLLTSSSRADSVGRASIGAVCPLSPEFGAKGDGIADDSAAMLGALEAADRGNRPLELANGFYNLASWKSYAWQSDHLTIRGWGAKTANVRLPNGHYFIDMSRALLAAHLCDFTCSGGKGFLRSRFAGTNVSHHKVFERILFLDYTECAVQANGRDEPYWLFRECGFLAANSTDTIGLAIGAGCDSSAVLFCNFQRNRIDLKFRQAGISTNIQGADFTRADAGQKTFPRIRIWYVPFGTHVNAGDGAQVSASKFGNENQQPFDFDILYADEGRGSYNGDKMPNLNAASSGYVVGHCYANNKFSGANALRLPIVVSFTPFVYANRIADNLFVGTYPPELMAFAPASGVPTAFDPQTHDITIGPNRRLSLPN